MLGPSPTLTQIRAGEDTYAPGKLVEYLVQLRGGIRLGELFPFIIIFYVQMEDHLSSDSLHNVSDYLGIFIFEKLRVAVGR